MSNSSDQAEYWTRQAGPKWVERQAELDALMQPVLDALLLQARPHPGERVLDIGCGAGASSLRAAELVGPEGQVLGVDISPPLLEKARARAAGIGNLSFACMDAGREPVTGAFDKMISRFGVMFFDDPVAAFRNISKALTPGAEMHFASWGEIAQNPFFTLPAQVAKRVLGPVPKTDPDAPGPFAFRDPERVQSILRDAGLAEIGHQVVDLHLTPEGDIETVAETFCAIGPASGAITHHAANADQIAALREALVQELGTFAWLDGIKIPARINLFHARSA